MSYFSCEICLFKSVIVCVRLCSTFKLYTVFKLYKHNQRGQSTAAHYSRRRFVVGWCPREGERNFECPREGERNFFYVHVKVSAILNVQWSTWRWAQLLFNTFWCTREGEHYFFTFVCSREGERNFVHFWMSTWGWANFLKYIYVCFVYFCMLT